MIRSRVDRTSANCDNPRRIISRDDCLSRFITRHVVTSRLEMHERNYFLDWITRAARFVLAFRDFPRVVFLRDQGLARARARAR